MLEESRPGAHVVLLRPRGAANLGAIARAMKNFGLSRLTLVDPRLKSWFEAWMMAVHAEDILRNAESVPRIDEALASATWIVGTTIRPLPGQRVLTPRQVAEEAQRRGPPTLLFGDEESGLQNEDLIRCHDVSMIPVSPDQPSLNLAAAVLVYAYELHAAGAPPPVVDDEPRADRATLVRIEETMRAALIEAGFQDVDRKRHGVPELMQPLYRAGLTDLEARLWLVAWNKSRAALTALRR